MASGERSAASASFSSASSTLGRGSAPGLIRPRQRAGLLHVILLSGLFAAVAAPIALAELGFADAFSVRAGEPSPVTVRVPSFAGYRDSEVSLSFGAVLIARGETATAETARVASSVLGSRPSGPAGWATFGVGLFLLCVFFSSSLRSCHRGKLVRYQLIIIALLLFGLAAIKAATLFTSVSVMAMPVAAFALLAWAAVDRGSGTITGLLAAFAVGSLVPFDPGVITVLVAQSVVPVLYLGDGHSSRRRLLLAGVVGGVAAVAAYVAYGFLYWGSLPVIDWGVIHQTGIAAAALGGLVSGPLAIVLLPGTQVALGDVTANRLVELEDFSNPLLQQIAERSPGTWQHSLAMANMAETAVHAVGGNGRLVRTGAYYHDLGKSLQPKYFIENLNAGEPSPHDSLAPEVSADVIFAHVTEGVRVGRKHGLPERIIDFMHMHHGDGRLEYFWSKCQELGNPTGLTEDAFCYPGLRPQSKETAVLAIVDAVEAASRTLRRADDSSIRNLVQRIVYGKLHLGQLDESGLTMAELRKISEALVTTIKHAHHGRIEYPWQKEERATEEAATRAMRPVERSDTGRVDVRLDSLDAPRPGYRRPGTEAGPSDASDTGSAHAPSARPRAASAPAADSSAALPAADSSAVPAPDGSSRIAALGSGTMGAEREQSAEERAARAVERTTPLRKTLPPPLPIPPAPARASPDPAPAADRRRLPPAMVVEVEPPKKEVIVHRQTAPSAPAPMPARAPAQGGTPSWEDVSEDEILLEQQMPPPSVPAPGATAAGSADSPFDSSDVGDEVDELDEVERTAPRGAVVREKRKSSNTGRLAEWEQALETALPPGASSPSGDVFDSSTEPGKRRRGRNTLALMKGGDPRSVLEPSTAEEWRSEPSTVSLSPGTLVVGPPPETHPRVKPVGDETVEVHLPIPPESVRPSKRKTTEHDIVPPREAFPDDTEPSAVAVLKIKNDKPT